jgi:AraC-like DNA-binding protein
MDGRLTAAKTGNASETLRALCVLAARYGTRAGFTSPMLPHLRLTASALPADPVCSVEGPAFAIVLQGAKRTMVGEKSYSYSAGQYLVLSLELPITAKVVRASVTEPFLSLGVLLRAQEIASLLLESAASDARPPLPQPGAPADGAGVAVSESTPELLDAVLRLTRLLERPEDAAVLRPMIEREIHWRLLNGPNGALIRQIGLADSRLSQISRAVSWMRRNFNHGLRMESLAEMAGMSVSTFHRNFRAVTAMSPLQFQKQIRLQEARTRLIADPRDVAAVGFAVGYESPSQFSREYRRQFGESPGRDAARLLEAAQGERAASAR